MGITPITEATTAMGTIPAMARRMVLREPLVLHEERVVRVAEVRAIGAELREETFPLEYDLYHPRAGDRALLR